MSNIYFLTDKLLPNYLDKSAHYKFRHGPLAFPGRYIHTAYNYWILKNAGIKNIKLTTNISDIGPDDILFFHYDDKQIIDFTKPFKKIQILSDKYRIIQADGHCAYDPSNMSLSDFLLSEPLPVGTVCKQANFPPKIFHTNTADHWIPKFLKNEAFLQKMAKENILITFENKRHLSIENFDVFFFIRDISCLDEKDEDGLPKHKICHYKNASRLYQSWHMEVPAIFSHHTSMSYVRKSEYDYLEANNQDEFIEKCLLLKNNQDFFNKMIENCQLRKKEFDNSIIVAQFKSIVEKLGSEFVYE